MQLPLLMGLLVLLELGHGFTAQSVSNTIPMNRRKQHPSILYLFGNDNEDKKSPQQVEEESRLKILESRRYEIRRVLRSAEATRNFRLRQGWVPEIDPETGKPVQSDGKLAVTLTAFCIAAGAIALRIGGRAALISAVGLDFVNDNPELKSQLDQILTTADTMDPVEKVALFTAGWTAVKVLCFDAGGVVLALSSGILFGGVLQGAAVSSAAATFGSSVAFFLAKLETPVRKKALELLEDYPSLRGIEKVVARDGLKAILTLRLAPVLPIPIGLYNYVYGVTNVPYVDFAGGIFLGSFKPYLLDSYLGFFGKEVIEGTSDGGGLQDVLLLTALGLSVLIGVFASQLASATWDSVLEEVEAEKKAKAGKEDADEKDGITRELFGIALPKWMVDFQMALQDAQERVQDLIADEYTAKVWNYTKADGGPPADLDPAQWPTAPEIVQAKQGIDFGGSICDGLVLSPLLFGAFTKYANPLYDEAEDETLVERSSRQKRQDEAELASRKEGLRVKLDQLKSQAQARIQLLDDYLRDEER